MTTSTATASPNPMAVAIVESVLDVAITMAWGATIVLPIAEAVAPAGFPHRGTPGHPLSVFFLSPRTIAGDRD